MCELSDVELHEKFQQKCTAKLEKTNDSIDPPRLVELEYILTEIKTEREDDESITNEVKFDLEPLDTLLCQAPIQALCEEESASDDSGRVNATAGKIVTRLQSK